MRTPTSAGHDYMTKPSDIGWAQASRLQYIDQLLLMNRRMVSRELTEQFGISRFQAGKDIKLYTELHPDNVQPYRPTDKAYLATDQFTPSISADHIVDNPECPSVYDVDLIHRVVKMPVLNALMNAIHNQKAVTAIYASASTPLGKKRTIAPTRLVRTSNRLHVRAYCLSRKEFRDFVISRFLTTPKPEKMNVNLPEDEAWEQKVELSIEINRNLPTDARHLIEREYEIESPLHVSMPKALLHYYLIDNNLPSNNETLDKAKSKPWAYPLVPLLDENVIGLLFGE